MNIIFLRLPQGEGEINALVARYSHCAGRVSEA